MNAIIQVPNDPTAAKRRQERGIIIAAMCKLHQQDGMWIVPSQTGADKRYTVDPAHGTCTCPDHQEWGHKCKHLYAVEITIKREQNSDGTITETKTITFTEKKTYKQDWPKYNEAQMTEMPRFQALLHDLCRGCPPSPQPKRGRKRNLMSDMVFASALKVFTTFSSRRFAGALADAFTKGYLSNLMHSVSVCAYLEYEPMTPVLKQLIVQSSLPLKAVETVFAPDSTGFSVSRFVRWFDEKYGTTRSGRDWVKAHAICGVHTKIVTDVEIEGRDAGDAPFFKPLVETTAKNFTVKEVPADKAYLSHDNLELVQKLGGTAYIPFKSNSQPGEAGSLWEKTYLFYQLHREEFMQHYHQRSNGETAFSMVKAKFRDHVRSKMDVAMKNEVLCKFLCHNICVVHQSQVELGIEPIFWPEKSPLAS